jgi:pimeloyl-ACP methyl ester carboxylesterase
MHVRPKWSVQSAVVATLALLGSCVLGLAVPVPAAAGDSSVRCAERVLPVSLAPGRPASHEITGVLCATRAELRPGAPVQLLIHGGTYNRSYWDFGTFDGREYSFARRVAAAGFATFAINSIGTYPIDQPGALTRRPPASADVTLDTIAHVVHQVVLGLKGEPGGTPIGGIPRFGNVIAVGHSAGTLASWQVALSYPSDFAGLIATGLAHHFSDTGMSSIEAFHPANQDPRFAGLGLDDGYLTSRPGRRGELFYHAPSADPAVIAADEAGKDIYPVTSMEQGFNLILSDATRAIGVPVLAVVGDRDILLCDDVLDCSSSEAVLAHEAPFYSAPARLHACAIADTGHDIALHRTRAAAEAAAIIWSYRLIHHGGAGPLPGCA